MSKSKRTTNDEVIVFFFRKKDPKTTNETIKSHSQSILSIRFMLLLAHQLHTMLERNQFKNLADIAQKVGITRARVTQILDLVFLAPQIQEEILHSPDRLTHIREGQLRVIVKNLNWSEQQQDWDSLKQSLSSNTSSILSPPKASESTNI